MIANLPFPSQAIDQVGEQQSHGADHSLLALKRQSLPLPPKLGCDNEMEDDMPAFTSNDRMAFPLKLYQMLSQASSEENDVGHSFEDIVSWEPHGKSFVIRDVEKFSTMVLPSFFSISKVSCFRRLLQVHGFSNLDAENNQTAQEDTYYHKLFKRGRPRLLTCLVRKRYSQAMSRTKMAPHRMSMDGATTTSRSEERADAAAVSESSDSESSEDNDEASRVSAPEQEEGAAPASQDTEPTSIADQNKGSQASLWDQGVPSLELSDANHDEMLLDFLEDVFVADEKKTSTSSFSKVVPDATPASHVPEKMCFDKSKVASPDFSKPSAVGGLMTKVSGLPPLGAIRAGPLRVPGHLRNGFGFGIKATCVHSVAKGQSARGSMVKTIIADLSSRNESERDEWTRFQKPLETAISSTEVEHIIWKSPFQEPERVCSKEL